ncbi:hypothetical protein CR513_55265, partial [Mucuna pruriens]
MEDCKVLKSQIEKLIYEGYLEHFVKRRENEKRTTREFPKMDRSRTPRIDRDREQNRFGNRRKRGISQDSRHD